MTAVLFVVVSAAGVLASQAAAAPMPWDSHTVASDVTPDGNWEPHGRHEGD
ncbi:hypothetical protein [Streptomyces sp. NPDC050264]|uniref:hypothetical protein n=1 Tax=Streptomyces sp. NPDC050264 TaxID=3155038 RepID=UPI00341813C5